MRFLLVGILNLLWFLLIGVYLAMLLFLTGLLLCITIIGIPLGIRCFKLIPRAMFPFV